jgi:hypothetical protein
LEESDFAKTRSERNQQQVERNFAGKTNSNHHYHITKETRTCDTMRSDSRDEMAGSGSRIAKLLFSLSSPELVTRYRYVALRDGTPPLPFPFMVDATQTQTRFALQRTLTTSLLPPCQVLHASPSSFTYLFFSKSASTAEKIVYQLK